MGSFVLPIALFSTMHLTRRGYGPLDKKIFDGARSLGDNPELAVNLHRAELKLQEGDSLALLRLIESNANNPNERERFQVLDECSLLAFSEHRPRILNILETAKSDTSELIQDQLPSFLALALAPGWQEVCISYTSSSNPQRQEAGKRALRLGETVSKKHP